MKSELPIPALAISYLGTITTIITEAKSALGALAAFTSLVASLYAIAVSRKRLHASRRGRRPRFKWLSPHTWLLAMLIACTFSGCSTANPNGKPSFLSNIAAIPTRLLDTAANLVTSTVTNVTEQAVVSATDIVSIDPQTLLSITNTTLHTNVMLVTNLTAIARPVVANSLNTAQSAATLLPPPYGETAAGIFALASGLLAAAVRRRNLMLKTVIHGVENGNQPETKQEIKDAAILSGVAPDLHTLVKKLTALALIFGALTFGAKAQSIATVTEGQSIPVLFDHTDHFAIRAYTNGIFFRAFPTNEVATLTTAPTNTYRITLPPLARGTINLTLTAIDTNGLESEQSTPLILQIRHRPPMNPRKDK